MVVHVSQINPIMVFTGSAAHTQSLSYLKVAREEVVGCMWSSGLVNPRNDRVCPNHERTTGAATESESHVLVQAV